jgi:hypothetical protein
MPRGKNFVPWDAKIKKCGIIVPVRKTWHHAGILKQIVPHGQKE